ncbi:hypothetical protein [Aerococcus vaginalis]
MILVFTAIDEMPQDMLDEGDQAEIDAYMLSKEIDLHFVNESQLRSFWGCVDAVTWAVGTTAVGVGMLAKIKKFVSDAGGIKAAATALMAIARNGFSAENISKFGAALVETSSVISSSVILGIKEIKGECFE